MFAWATAVFRTGQLRFVCLIVIALGAAGSAAVVTGVIVFRTPARVNCPAADEAQAEVELELHNAENALRAATFLCDLNDTLSRFQTSEENGWLSAGYRGLGPPIVLWLADCFLSHARMLAISACAIEVQAEGWYLLAAKHQTIEPDPDRCRDLLQLSKRSTEIERMAHMAQQRLRQR